MGKTKKNKNSKKLRRAAAPYANNKQTRQNLPQTAAPNASFKETKQKLPQTSTPNVSFYQNKIPSSPNKEYIEDILHKWPGNYEKLEKNPSYIQWLFPNRMPGVNQHAFILTDEEVEIINKSPKLKEKVKNAFEMMLDYYGMRITKDNQFELTENSRERLAGLNQRRNPDFKRISRILLAIKELGHIDLMRPWMIFLADLIYKEKKLEQASESFLQFWIETLDAEDKIFLTQYVEQFNL